MVIAAVIAALMAALLFNVSSLADEADDLDISDFVDDEDFDGDIASLTEGDGGSSAPSGSELPPETGFGTAIIPSGEELVVSGIEEDEEVAWVGELAPAATEDEIVEDLEDASGVEIEGRDDFHQVILQSILAEGSDVYVGSTDDDRITTSNARDLAIGWEGDDTIFLGDGNDVLGFIFTNEGAGNDSIRGGNGHDIIIDVLGENTIRGDAGDDLIDGLDDHSDLGAGDFLIGGVGDDTIIGDSGDTLAAGPGEDELIVYVPETDEDADPAVITDFDAEDDTLRIMIETDTPKAVEQYDVSFVDRTDTDDETDVLVDGELVLTLQGVAPADISEVIVGNYRIAEAAAVA